MKHGTQKPVSDAFETPRRQRRRGQPKRWVLLAAQLLVLLMINLAQAGGLGVTGDGFLTTYSTWIPTLLFLAMLAGIALWLSSSSDYNQGLLAGSVSLFSRGVIGGGAVAILAAMGLSMGAVIY
jgi:hypothetical protein